MKKKCQVLKQLKKFQANVIQQIININKSLKHYTLLFLINVEPSNLVFLKTCNLEFDELFITFADQNGRALEIEAKVNLVLLINKTKKYVKRYRFCHS